MAKFSWAVNDLKLHRATVKANADAKLLAEVNKTPFQAPKEAEIKALYISYGGLVAENKEELNAAKEKAKMSAREALEARIKELEDKRKDAIRAETMKDGESDMLSALADELKSLKAELRKAKKLD